MRLRCLSILVLISCTSEQSLRRSMNGDKSDETDSTPNSGEDEDFDEGRDSSQITGSHLLSLENLGIQCTIRSLITSNESICQALADGYDPSDVAPEIVSLNWSVPAANHITNTQCTLSASANSASGASALATKIVQTCQFVSDSLEEVLFSVTLTDTTGTTRSVTRQVTPALTSLPRLSIGPGASFSCIHLADGTTKCWGYNDSGQLGIGSRDVIGDDPGEVASLAGVPLGSTIAQISAGSLSTCAILNDESLKCWGENGAGALGLEDTVDRGDNAGEIAALLSPNLGTGRKAVSISTGQYFACAILDNDEVKCWGENAFAQHGNGDASLAEIGDNVGEMGDNLVAAPLGTGLKPLQIVSSVAHNCAILRPTSQPNSDANDVVKCWGNNFAGQLGVEHANTLGDDLSEMGDNLPAVNLGTGMIATQLALGNNFSCALLKNNQVKCWGVNVYGNLGRENTTNLGDQIGSMGDNLAAIDLGTGRLAIQIAAGRFHTCALLDNQTIKCWGRNHFGQLGQEHTTNIGDSGGSMGDALNAITFNTASAPKQVSCGTNFTCAVFLDDSVRCWGLNDIGQLGLGDSTARGGNPGDMAALPVLPL